MINSKKNISEDTLLKIYTTKIQEALKLKELNEELLDHTHNLLIRTIQICRKNNIPIDHETRALIRNVTKILHQIQNPLQTTIFQQHFTTPDESTEPSG